MTVTAAARSVWWWFTSVLGANDYARYVEHRRTHHPDDPVLCESDYWRTRYAEAETRPGARCC